jgi:large repetitive protein
MKTSFKPITYIQTWRLAAITLAMTLATQAFAMGPGPQPPNLNGNGNATGTVGVAFSYTISATNSPTSYNATGLPPGLTVSTTTGLISGTPTTVGTYNPVHLSATNAAGTGTKDVTFKINSAPTATATSSPAAVWVGETVTLDGTASHTNPPGGTLDYNWQQLAPAVGTLVIALTPAPPNETDTETFIAPAPQPLGTLSWPVTYTLKVTDNAVSGGAKNTTSAPVTTTVYAAPVADAEPKNAHRNENTLVMLSGSATNPQPGATFSYKWTAPAGITLFPTDTAQNPTFTAPFVGTAGQALTFTLVVTEHLAGLATDKASAPDSVTINVDNVNAPPTAVANSVNDPNNIVSPGVVAENTDPVTLYGFGSDPDGDTISFHWTQVHDATGAPLQGTDTAVGLSSNTSMTPTFVAPNLTTQDHIDLFFQLTTNDGLLDSGPSFVTIRVNNTNNPPTAAPAVSPLSALEGESVTLDGSASTDPDGDSLTYTWAQTGAPPGPVVTLSPNNNDVMPSFVAPAVSVAQGSIGLTFNLTVDDGFGGTDTKPVSVTIYHKNLPPVAIANATVTVPAGGTAHLDGSTSYDPEGDALTFTWVQVPAVGEPVVGMLTPEDPPTNSKMSFDAPTVGPAGADLHFQLTIADGHNPPVTAAAVVHVTYVNHPPTANPGNDQNKNEGDTVSLIGSGTDPDGNPLTFTWSYLSGPAITLNVDPSDSSKATFTAPQVFCAGGAVVMTLTVDDSFGGTDSKNVTINIANLNHAPSADAGGNQSNIHEGDLVELHGTGDDADTEEVGSLQFQWTQTSGPLPWVTLSGSGKDVSFTAPSIGGGNPDAFVELGFSLTVTDSCSGSTTTDPVIVHVANIPHAPVAVATTGSPTANEGGDTVTLDGSGSSDPDGDTLTYTWTQVGTPLVSLTPSGSNATFVTPWVSADTPLKFKLTVTDPYGDTSSAYVCVTVNNWNTPPDVSGAHADVPVLWPPDHKMIQVHILGVTDAQNNATITINSVTQDERTNGLGDGDTPIDAIVSGDSVLLRAERSGNANGRVYKVCFTAADPEGHVDGCVKVMVPKSKKTDIAIDSGQNYDSTH